MLRLLQLFCLFWHLKYEALEPATFKHLVECSAACAPLSVVTCGPNFIVEAAVHNNSQAASQVQGNIF